MLCSQIVCYCSAFASSSSSPFPPSHLNLSVCYIHPHFLFYCYGEWNLGHYAATTHANATQTSNATFCCQKRNQPPAPNTQQSKQSYLQKYGENIFTQLLVNIYIYIYVCVCVCVCVRVQMCVFVSQCMLQIILCLCVNEWRSFVY